MKMYYLIVSVMVAMLLVLAINDALSAEHLVEMKGMKFIPQDITVKKGDTVIFRNTTNVLHNVETKDKKIKSKMLKKNEEFKYKFDEVGKIEYYCKPHKNMGMVGTVKVEE